MSNLSDDGWGSPVAKPKRVVESCNPKHNKTEVPPPRAADNNTKGTSAGVSDIDVKDEMLNSMKKYLNEKRCHFGPVETTLYALENNAVAESKVQETINSLSGALTQIFEETEDCLIQMDSYLQSIGSWDPAVAMGINSSAEKIFELVNVYRERLTRYTHNREANKVTNSTPTPQQMTNYSVPSSPQVTNHSAPSTQTFSHTAQIQIASDNFHCGKNSPKGVCASDSKILGFAGMMEHFNQMVVNSMAQTGPVAGHTFMLKGLLDILAETGEKLIALRDAYVKQYADAGS